MRAASAALALLVLCAPCVLSDTRRLLARDIPVASCANTVQGRWHVTDDRGFHCPREQLDGVSGCCLKGDQFSCRTCSADDKCCSDYEQCVSCCMAPNHKAEDVLKKVYRGPSREETGRWPNAFEYCRGKCRTSANSTVHENAYLAPGIHCFSDLGKPMTDEPSVPELSADTQLVAGEQGETCAAACQRADIGGCSAAGLPAANSCNLLRATFPCEAGCGPHPSLGGLPGYTVGTADKQEQPAFCWTAPEGSQADRGCDAASPNIQRLCPCSLLQNTTAAAVAAD